MFEDLVPCNILYKGIIPVNDETVYKLSHSFILLPR